MTLRAAPRHPALAAAHGCLDSWRGIGDVVVGMHRQGYDVQLTQVRCARLARHVLRDRHGTLSH